MRFVILLSRELELPDLPQACGSEAWPAGRASLLSAFTRSLALFLLLGGAHTRTLRVGKWAVGFSPPC